MSGPMIRTAEELATALGCGRPGCGCGKRSGTGYKSHCPAHDDPNPSMTLADGDKRTVFRCHAGCSQTAVIEALKERGLWSAAPSRNGHKPPGKETRYEVRDVAGKLIAVHVRRDLPTGEKKFSWEGANGENTLNGLSTRQLPLYASERLSKLPDDASIVLSEGEKATDALWTRGVPSVGTVTGAATTPDSNVLQSLLPYRVYLWPDADDAGRQHMSRIAILLSSLGHEHVGIIDWTEAPPGGDAADHPGDKRAIQVLAQTAKRYEPEPPVGLPGLLAEIKATIRKYVVLTDAQAVALAVWVAHTHAIAAADVTPYLNVHSPEKRSGKSRLLEVLKHLVRHPWLTARTSPAALYRRVDAEQPTLLLDESDAAFKGGDDYSEALRGVLNSGFERGGSVTVCIGQGKDISYREFQTFGAKAIAGIGQLPDTIADRAISIAMKRQAPSEKAEKLRRRRIRLETEPLRGLLSEWAVGAVAKLADAEPSIPGELDDRAADGWEPLLAIADIAGGPWPELARDAAKALSVGDGREDSSLNVRLLADIWSVFEERDTDRLSIGDLVAALVAIEEAPWGDLKDGKPLNARSLGWRLRGYEIKAQTIRLDTSETPRGYYRETFRDAVSRYLPEKASQTDTTDTSDTKTSGGFDPCVAFKTDTQDESDTEFRCDVSVVTDVSVSQGVGEEVVAQVPWKLWPGDEIVDPPAPSANGKRRCSRCLRPMSPMAISDECGVCVRRDCRRRLERPSYDL